MGKEDNADFRKVDGGNTTRSGSSSKSTTATSTRRRGSGGIGGTGGTGGTGGKTEEKGISKLATVESKPSPKIIEIGGDSENISETVKEIKPKKARAKSSKKDTFDNTQITILITSLSAVIACRPDMEHWLITKVEAEQISQPLAKIFEESEKFSEVSKYSNHIALLIACFVITMPRILITLDKQKIRKERLKNDGRKAETKETPKGNGDIQKSNASNGSNDVTTVPINIEPTGFSY